MKKDIILFTAIFLVLSMIAGGTYAYWQWINEEETTVVFNTVKGLEEYIYYDAGQSHFVGNFQPSSTHCGGQSSTVSFYLKDGAPFNANERRKLYTTLMMDINSMDSTIASSSAVKWAVTQGSNSDCGTVLASGDFSGKVSGNNFKLLSDIEILNQTTCGTAPNISSNCQYTVWLWIDSNGSNLSSLSGKTIDVNIWSQIDMIAVSESEDVVNKAAGEYETADYDESGLLYSWDELISHGWITVAGDVLVDGFYVDGYLMISNKITSIGANAFSNSHAEGVYIPFSVRYIEEDAFSDGGFNSITYGGTMEEWNEFVELSYFWNSQGHITKVICSDGTINV